jgi:hypothetical protein
MIEQFQLSNPSSKTLSKDYIALYFSTQFKYFSTTSLFKLSSELLNKRLLEISQELQNSLNLT